MYLLNFQADLFLKPKIVLFSLVFHKRCLKFLDLYEKRLLIDLDFKLEKMENGINCFPKPITKIVITVLWEGR